MDMETLKRMVFDTLEDIEFEPFFNVSRYYIIAWGAVNFMKLIYVILSTKQKRFPATIIASMAAVITFFYCIKTQNSTMFWVIMGLYLTMIIIVRLLIYRRDVIIILSLVIFTVPAMIKPFPFIIDVFTCMYLLFDFPTLFFENTPLWSTTYMLSLILATVSIQLKDMGFLPLRILTSCASLWLLGILVESATNKHRFVSLFAANIAYIMLDIERFKYYALGFKYVLYPFDFKIYEFNTTIKS